jgi:methionine biosynthesis protein MetW
MEDAHVSLLACPDCRGKLRSFGARKDESGLACEAASPTSASLEAAYDDVYQGKKPGRQDLDLARWPRNRLEACVANAPPGGRVLDVGCGNGKLLYNLRHKFDELCGIEFAATRVEIAALALEGLDGDVRQGNIEERLPWDDGYFDVIVLSDVIEHVVNLWPAMEEISRLLKPDGHVVLSTPNIACLKARLLLLLGVFPASKPKEGFALRTNAELHDGGHVHYFTFSMLDHLFARYGFAKVEKFGLGRFGRLHNLRPQLLSSACMVVASRSPGQAP